MYNLKKLLAAKTERWLEVKNQTGDVAEIRIDGVIGGGWDSDDKTAGQFIAELNAITAPAIELHVNSPGGDVFHGLAMYNALRIVAEKKKVSGYVDGVAASIASVVIQACPIIIMPENSFLMIHDPWTIMIGNARELRATADELDQIGDSIVKIYTDRSGAEEKKIRELMVGTNADGSFISASDALELGLCTEVIENAKAAACIGLDVFDELPESLRRLGSAMDKRVLENSLRDAGYSASMAKLIASGRAAVTADGEQDHDWNALLNELKGQKK